MSKRNWTKAGKTGPRLLFQKIHSWKACILYHLQLKCSRKISGLGYILIRAYSTHYSNNCHLVKLQKMKSREKKRLKSTSSGNYKALTNSPSKRTQIYVPRSSSFLAFYWYANTPLRSLCSEGVLNSAYERWSAQSSNMTIMTRRTDTTCVSNHITPTVRAYMWIYAFICTIRQIGNSRTSVSTMWGIKWLHMLQIKM